MDLYACDSCGYYYDPEYGDEENHIDVGTAFEKLPSDWVCPECNASKCEFCRLGSEELEAFDEYDLVFEDFED